MSLVGGRNKIVLLCIITVLLTLARPFLRTEAFTSTLPNRYIKLSDSIAGHTSVTYDMGFDTTNPLTIGSVEFEFCENDPFPGTSCTVPAGLNVSGSTLLTQSGTNDFIVDGSSTNAHKIVYTRTPSLVAPTSFHFEINNVDNPGNPSSQYARIRIFTGSNLGGSIADMAGIAYAVTGDLIVSTTVPPYIDLCVGKTITTNDCTAPVGNIVDFGDLSITSTKFGTSQFAAATNADNGYVITISGSSLTSGNNVIKSLANLGIATPGVNQFGMNLRNNVAPDVGSEPTGIGAAAPVGNYAIPDNFIFNNGDAIASVAGPDNYRTFTASYIVNIDANQPAGYYSTTLTFIALGNF